MPPAVVSAVPRLVNEAIRSMQRDYNWKVMESATTFITVEGTALLGTIANFKEYRDLGPQLLRQYSKAKRLTTNSQSDTSLAILSSTSNQREPQAIRHAMDIATGASTFRVAPLPDVNSDWNDGNYQIFIPTYIYSDLLVNDADQNWFTNNAADYITYKATAEAFGRDWDYDSMALWLQRADEKKKEIKKADKMLRLSGVNELVPLWKGANQPPLRS